MTALDHVEPSRQTGSGWLPSDKPGRGGGGTHWPTSPAAQLAREESEYEKRQSMHTHAMQACIAQMDNLRALLVKEREKASMLEAWVALQQQQGHHGPPSPMDIDTQLQQVLQRARAWMPSMPSSAAGGLWPPADDAACEASASDSPQGLPSTQDKLEVHNGRQPEARTPGQSAASSASPQHLEQRGALEERTPSPIAFMFAPSPHPAPVRPSDMRPDAAAGADEAVAEQEAEDASLRQERQLAGDGRRPRLQQGSPPQAVAAGAASAGRRLSSASTADTSGESAPVRASPHASSSVPDIEGSIDGSALRLTPEMAQAIVERIRRLSPEAADRLGLESFEASSKPSKQQDSDGAAPGGAWAPTAPVDILMAGDAPGREPRNKGILGGVGTRQEPYEGLKSDGEALALAALPVSRSARDKAARSAIFAELDADGEGYLSLGQLLRGLAESCGLGGLKKLEPAIKHAFIATKSLGKGKVKVGADDDRLARSEFRILVGSLKLRYELCEIFAVDMEGGALDSQPGPLISAGRFAAALPTLMKQCGLNAADGELVLKRMEANQGQLLFDDLCEVVMSRNLLDNEDRGCRGRDSAASSPPPRRPLPLAVSQQGPALPASANRFGYVPRQSDPCKGQMPLGGGRGGGGCGWVQ